MFSHGHHKKDKNDTVCYGNITKLCVPISVCAAVASDAYENEGNPSVDSANYQLFAQKCLLCVALRQSDVARIEGI